MARCPRCRKGFATLEDEEGMHDCPHCGFGPDESWPPRECEQCGEPFTKSDAANPEAFCSEVCEHESQGEQQCSECGEWVITLSSDGFCDGCVEKAANQPEEGDPD